MEREKLLKEQAFVLTRSSDDVSLKVKWVANDESLPDTLYRPVIAALAENSYAAKTLGELSEHRTLKTLSFDQLTEVVLVLVGTDHAAPVQPSSADARKRCAALNRHICELAADGGSDIHCLASPLTGSGITTDRLQQLFMLASSHNQPTAEAQASSCGASCRGRGSSSRTAR
jgi:hypothetical protein